MGLRLCVPCFATDASRKPQPAPASRMGLGKCVLGLAAPPSPSVHTHTMHTRTAHRTPLPSRRLAPRRAWAHGPRGSQDAGCRVASVLRRPQRRAASGHQGGRGQGASKREIHHAGWRRWRLPWLVAKRWIITACIFPPTTTTTAYGVRRTAHGARRLWVHAPDRQHQPTLRWQLALARPTGRRPARVGGSPDGPCCCRRRQTPDARARQDSARFSAGL